MSATAARRRGRGSGKLAGLLLAVVLAGPLVGALTDAGGPAPAQQPVMSEVTPPRAPANTPSRPRSRTHRNRAATDTGAVAEVPAVKAAIQRAQQRFNDVQMLSTDPRRRWRQARAIWADVQAARARGAGAFVAEAIAAGAVPGSDRPPGAGVTDFRIKLVNALDASVVVAEAERLSQALVQDTADSFLPSLVQSTFLVDEWQGVQVRGDQATALLIGRYANCFEGGHLTSRQCVTDRRAQWQLTMRRGPDGVWRLARRVGGDTREVPRWMRAAVVRGQYWLFDLYELHARGRGQVDWRRYYLTRTAAQRAEIAGYGAATDLDGLAADVNDVRVRRGHVTLTAVAHVTGQPEPAKDGRWPACMFQ